MSHHHTRSGTRGSRGTLSPENSVVGTLLAPSLRQCLVPMAATDSFFWRERVSVGRKDPPALSGCRLCPDVWMWGRPVHRVSPVGEQGLLPGPASRGDGACEGEAARPCRRWFSNAPLLGAGVPASAGLCVCCG